MKCTVQGHTQKVRMHPHTHFVRIQNTGVTQLYAHAIDGDKVAVPAKSIKVVNPKFTWMIDSGLKLLGAKSHIGVRHAGGVPHRDHDGHPVP